MDRVDKVIGIDLGTTSSIASVLSLDDEALLMGRVADGPFGHILPSAVAWHPRNRQILIGWEARARRGLEPEPILSIKRSMGTGLKRQLGNDEVSPEYISSLILRRLVQALRSSLPEDHQHLLIERAVITVPAHFKDSARSATRRAGELAGLQVVELLLEPTAAAIHFSWQRRRQQMSRGETADDAEETLMICDIGGGTFDVSVIKRLPGSTAGDDFQTLGTEGESFLGGDDLDAAIALDLFRRIAEGNVSAGSKKNYKFQTLNPGDVQNRVRWAKLLAVAEQVKIRLADQQSISLDMPGFFDDDDGRSVHLKTTYSVSEVERLIRPDLERMHPFCDKALAEARVDISQIDTILMIGGSSHVPLAQQLITEWYCSGEQRARCPHPIVHAPRICVGAGAALQAASKGRIHHAENCQVPVVLRDYGSCTQPIAPMRIDLLTAETGASIERGTVTIRRRDGATVVGEVLGPNRALFEEIPLEEEQVNFFTFTADDASSQAVAEASFSLRHNRQFVPPIGRSTSANVLSFSIGLEVRDEDRNEVTRVVLAKKLEPLPRRDMTHQFFFPEGAQTLLLPVYGDNRLIRRIRIPVGRGIDPGTPVELTVSIDANQTIRCHGRILDDQRNEPFQFDIEAPEPEPVPSRDECERLFAKVEALMAQYRDRPDVNDKLIEALKLMRSIQSAIDRGDDAQLIQRKAELEDLLEEIDPSRMRVNPPLQELEKIAAETQAVLSELAPTTTIDVSELRKDVTVNEAAARDAAKQVPPEHTTYGRCFLNIKNAREVVFREYERQNPKPPEQVAVELIKHGYSRLPRAKALASSPEEQRDVERAEDALHQAESRVSGDARRAADDARRALQLIQKVLEAHPENKPDAADVTDTDDGAGHLVMKHRRQTHSDDSNS